MRNQITRKILALDAKLRIFIYFRQSANNRRRHSFANWIANAPQQMNDAEQPPPSQKKTLHTR